VSRITVPVLLLAAAAAVASTAASPASDLPGNTVSISDGRATFALPGGWTEIPPSDLEELTMRVAEATGGGMTEYYQHGYFPPSFIDDPWPPRLLVQIRESGRISYGRFLHLDSEPGEANALNGKLPLILGAAVDRMDFDTARMCIHLEHTLDLRFTGRIRILTAAFLTERGLFALHFADREQRIAESRRVFDAVVASVSLDPEIAYQRRLTDRWPGLPFFAAAALMTVLLIFTIARRRRRP